MSWNVCKHTYTRLNRLMCSTRVDVRQRNRLMADTDPIPWDLLGHCIYKLPVQRVLWRNWSSWRSSLASESDEWHWDLKFPLSNMSPNSCCLALELCILVWNLHVSVRGFHWPREDIMLADPNSYRFVWWEVPRVNGCQRSPRSRVFQVLCWVTEMLKSCPLVICQI